MTSADLTGRSGGYRGTAIRCPGCAEAMRQVSLEKADAEVDICDACGGLWVDWFDGEVRAIAAEVRDSVPSPPNKGEVTSRNEAVAIGACPRCTRQLVNDRYEGKAEVQSARLEERISVVSAVSSAELLRCEDCMGAFVTRTSAEVLTSIDNESDQPPVSRRNMKPLPWDRFIALIRAFLGVGDKPA